MENPISLTLIYGNSYMDAPERVTGPPRYKTSALPASAIGTVCTVTLLYCCHPPSFTISNSQFLYCSAQKVVKLKFIFKSLARRMLSQVQIHVDVINMSFF